MPGERNYYLRRDFVAPEWLKWVRIVINQRTDTEFYRARMAWLDARIRETHDLDDESVQHVIVKMSDALAKACEVVSDGQFWSSHILTIHADLFEHKFDWALQYYQDGKVEYDEHGYRSIRDSAASGIRQRDAVGIRYSIDTTRQLGQRIEWYETRGKKRFLCKESDDSLPDEPGAYWVTEAIEFCEKIVADSARYDFGKNCRSLIAMNAPVHGICQTKKIKRRSPMTSNALILQTFAD